MAKKLKLWIDTGFAAAIHEEIRDLPHDWEVMSEKDREEYIEEEARDYRNDHIEFGGCIVDVVDKDS